MMRLFRRQSPLPPAGHVTVEAVSEAELAAGCAQARSDFNAAGYGSFVSDDQIKFYVYRILQAAVHAKVS